MKQKLAINITVEQECKRALRLLAASNDHSLTEECRDALTHWVEINSKKRRGGR